MEKVKKAKTKSEFNEEGLLLGLPENRPLPALRGVHQVVGTVVLVGVDAKRGLFEPLSSQKAEAWAKRLG